MGNPESAVATATARRKFHAQVVARLGEVMQSRGLLLLGGGPWNCATLCCKGCWLRLNLDKDGEVTCVLIDPDTGAAYELLLYLLLTIRERVVTYLPGYCEDADAAAVSLDMIAAALGDRALEVPLSGDFSWAMDYRLLYEEAFTVGEELLPVLRRGGGDLRELGRLVLAGDPRWVVEGRRVLGN